MITTPQKAAQKPSMAKLGNKKETKNRRLILIISVNNPKVKMIKGRENKTSTGLIKTFTTPSKAPLKSRLGMLISMLIPSINLTAA